MPKSDRNLFQVRLSETERRHIKALAASQGMTHQQAVVAAFAAWAEKLNATDRAAEGPPAQADEPKVRGRSGSAKDKTGRQVPSAAGTASQAWLQQAAKLDWTRCPEVEVMQGKDRRLWVLRGTLAPLAEVLQSVAGGHTVENVAKVFEVDPKQVKKVLKFAGATELRG